MISTCSQTDATGSFSNHIHEHVLHTHTNKNVEINTVAYETSVQVTCVVHVHMDTARGVNHNI